MPLGLPVEPDVYSRKIGSSPVIGSGAQNGRSLAIASCIQMSRPSTQPISGPPVRL